MLDDLDKTFEKLLRQELPSSLASQLAISFLAPNAEFPPSSVTPPALNLFLYDVREDREWRTGDWALERDAAGVPTGRRAPPVRIECSYLITAWPSTVSSDPAGDEHRLLGEVIRALVRHPVLPAGVLQGSLKQQPPALPASSLQPGRLQSIAELWQAAGGRPKAAITSTITLEVQSVPPKVVGPPVEEPVVKVTIGVPEH
jgi:hypothetical protein